MRPPRRWPTDGFPCALSTRLSGRGGALVRAMAAAMLGLLFVTPARTQEEQFWSFLPAGQMVKRCAESSPAHTRARTRFENLDERISQLADIDPSAKSVEALHDLLKSECFQAASETARVPRPDTALSLREWWTAAGGREWMASYLELPLLGSTDSLVPHVVVPPDTRKTLNLERHRDHPLQRLLCATGDAACGAATRGWKLRADAQFDAHQALGLDDAVLSPDDRPAANPTVASRECAQTTKAAGSDRYQPWRDCIEARRPRRTALPLGDVKAPSDGWLIVSGRRGHYAFCDTTRAYELTTGAAFIHDSCSALALTRDGRVDRDATNRARVEHVRAGTISADNLKEAVWMMLFRGEAEDIQLEAAYFPLPSGLVPEPIVGRRAPDDSGRGMTMNTGQTLLTWRWLPAGGDAFAGDLTWPASYAAAEDHAVKLLDIAEQSFVEGCSPAPLPSRASLKPVRAVNLNDVDADWMEELDANLRTALEKWKALPFCRPSPQ